MYNTLNKKQANSFGNGFRFLKETVNKKPKELKRKSFMSKEIVEKKPSFIKETVTVEYAKLQQRNQIKSRRLVVSPFDYSDFAYIQSDKLISRIISNFFQLNNSEFKAYCKKHKQKRTKAKSKFLLLHKNKLQQNFFSILMTSRYIDPRSLGYKKVNRMVTFSGLLSKLSKRNLKKTNLSDELKLVLNRGLFKKAIWISKEIVSNTSNISLLEKTEGVIRPLLKAKLTSFLCKLLLKLKKKRGNGFGFLDASHVIETINKKPEREFTVSYRNSQEVKIDSNKFLSNVIQVQKTSKLFQPFSKLKLSRFQYKKRTFNNYFKRSFVKPVRISCLKSPYSRKKLFASVLKKLKKLIGFKNKKQKMADQDNLVRIKWLTRNSKSHLTFFTKSTRRSTIKPSFGNLIYIDQHPYFQSKVDGFDKKPQSEVKSDSFIMKLTNDLLLQNKQTKTDDGFSMLRMLEKPADNCYQSNLVSRLTSNLNSGKKFFSSYFQRICDISIGPFGPHHDLIHKVNQMLFNQVTVSGFLDKPLTRNRRKTALTPAFIYHTYKNHSFVFEFTSDLNSVCLIQKPFELDGMSKQKNLWWEAEQVVLSKYKIENTRGNQVKQLLNLDKIEEQSLISFTANELTYDVNLLSGNLSSYESFAKESENHSLIWFVNKLSKQEKNGTRYDLRSSLIGRNFFFFSIFERLTSLLPSGFHEKKLSFTPEITLTLKQLDEHSHVYRNLFGDYYSPLLLDDSKETKKASVSNKKRPTMEFSKTSVILDAKYLHKFIVEQYYVSVFVKKLCKTRSMNASRRRDIDGLKNAFRLERTRASPYDLVLSTKINLPRVQRIKKTGSDFLNGRVVYKTNEYFRKQVYRTVRKQKLVEKLHGTLYFWLINWNRSI